MFEFAVEFGYTPKEFKNLYIDEFQSLIDSLSVSKLVTVRHGINQIMQWIKAFFGIKDAEVVDAKTATPKELSKVLPTEEVSQQDFDAWLEAGMPNPKKFFRKKKK